MYVNSNQWLLLLLATFFIGITSMQIQLDKPNWNPDETNESTIIGGIEKPKPKIVQGFQLLFKNIGRTRVMGYKNHQLHKRLAKLMAFNKKSNEKSDSSMCPVVSRKQCSQWKNQFKQVKHCCADVQDDWQSCSTVTQSKCNDFTWILNCCQKWEQDQSNLENIDHQLNVDSTTTTTINLIAESATPNDPVNLNNHCNCKHCEILSAPKQCQRRLAKLGYVRSFCCPGITKEAIKLSQDDLSAVAKICKYLSDDFCYDQFHNFKLEHHCCIGDHHRSACNFFSPVQSCLDSLKKTQRTLEY